MKAFLLTTTTLALGLAMTGCVGTKALSSNISDEGTVAKENIVFPDIDKAWQKDGIYPNTENLAKIRKGISKSELYHLIGAPHFSELQKAREWDYIMKFHTPNHGLQTCQYKIIFDKDYQGQEFYWQPAECEKYAKPIKHPVAPMPMPVAVAIPERVSLSADALFAFDKWQPQNLLPQGKVELDDLAHKLVQHQQKGGKHKVTIVGHTDYLGDDLYNMNLSLRRAQTVRTYLIERGVAPESLSASGAGESQPVKQCQSTNRNALIECLKPNRRVEVMVSVE